MYGTFVTPAQRPDCAALSNVTHSLCRFPRFAYLCFGLQPRVVRQKDEIIPHFLPRQVFVFWLRQTPVLLTEYGYKVERLVATPLLLSPDYSGHLVIGDDFAAMLTYQGGAVLAIPHSYSKSFISHL